MPDAALPSGTPVRIKASGSATSQEHDGKTGQTREHRTCAAGHYYEVRGERDYFLGWFFPSEFEVLAAAPSSSLEDWWKDALRAALVRARESLADLSLDVTDIDAALAESAPMPGAAAHTHDAIEQVRRDGIDMRFLGEEFDVVATREPHQPAIMSGEKRRAAPSSGAAETPTATEMADPWAKHPIVLLTRKAVDAWWTEDGGLAGRRALEARVAAVLCEAVKLGQKGVKA